MNRKFKILMIIWISILLILFGCSSNPDSNPDYQPGKSITIPTKSPTLTPTPESSLTLTPSLTSTIPELIIHLSQTKTPTASWKTWEPKEVPDPIILQEQVDKYLSQESNCKIPCWLGVTNGYTWFEGALTTLKTNFHTDLYTIVYPDGLKIIRVGLPASGSRWSFCLG